MSLVEIDRRSKIGEKEYDSGCQREAAEMRVILQEHVFFFSGILRKKHSC